MTFQVIEADCLELLPKLRPQCVDALVCDPPYGLSFMGRAWDHGVPGAPFWEAALRVAKPGAYLVAFGGTRTHHRLACAIEDGGWELRDCLMWLYGSGFPKSHNLEGGLGTALKPAWEPIIMARAPLAGTIAANVAGFGCGALNIDACRVGLEGIETHATAARGGLRLYGGGSPDARPIDGPERYNAAGRWPANVLLDDEAGALLDAAVGQPGPSRFFYCAKASKAEREAGLDTFLPQVVHDGRKVPIDNPYLRAETERRNTHPTVKPLALMRWLVRLVTPPGGLVLDQFCGSGSTGCAAVLEGFNFLGIDKEPDFVRLSQARIAHYEKSIG